MRGGATAGATTGTSRTLRRLRSLWSLGSLRSERNLGGFRKDIFVVYRKNGIKVGCAINCGNIGVLGLGKINNRSKETRIIASNRISVRSSIYTHLPYEEIVRNLPGKNY